MQRQTHGLALASMSERHKLRLGNRWPVINSRQMIYGLRAGVLTILLGTSSVLVSVQTQTPESTNAGRSQSQAPLRVGGKVSAPRVKWDPEPEYSPMALRLGYQGVCVLWLIVDTDGKPRDIKVARSLGLGLDEKAIEAVQRWRFEPAMKDGKPVAVQINVEVNFRTDGGDRFIELSQKVQAGEPKAELEMAKVLLESPRLNDQRYAMDLLTKAASQGLRNAQFLLGERFYKHPIGAQDYVSAYMWYALARQYGEKKSEAPLKELTSKMTPEQLAEAQARVDTWRPISAK
jgi:TonB family protein